METPSLFRTILGIAVLLILLYFVLTYILTPNYDKREPPVIPTFLPYAGHIINLIHHGQKYFEILWYLLPPYPLPHLTPISSHSHFPD